MAEDDLAQYVQKIMDGPSRVKDGGGRIWYDPTKGSVVLEDVHGGGSVFVPTDEVTGEPRGWQYFLDNIEK